MNELLPPPPRYSSLELESIIRSKGGLFRLEGDHHKSTVKMFRVLGRRLDGHVQLSESLLYEDKTRRICYDVLCGSELNAFAYATPQGEVPAFDFVGLNIGAILTLFDVFKRILAHPDCFPDVGNNRLEDSSRPIWPDLSTNLFRSAHPPCEPKCPVRHLFSGELAQIALDFLFFHEITHLRNGHVEYARENLLVAFLAEIVAVSEGDKSLIRQTLEFDADCGAVLHTFNQAFRVKDRLASLRPSVTEEAFTALGSAYLDASVTARTVAYSIYMLFRLFDDCGWDASHHARSHPQPAVRMSWVAPAIFEVLQHEEYGYDSVQFAAGTGEVVVAAESDYARVRGQLPDFRGILGVITDSYIDSPAADYLTTLRETWRTLRPSLDENKRGGTLAD